MTYTVCSVSNGQCIVYTLIKSDFTHSTTYELCSKILEYSSKRYMNHVVNIRI